MYKQRKPKKKPKEKYNKGKIHCVDSKEDFSRMKKESAYLNIGNENYVQRTGKKKDLRKVNIP